ncbi:hypothetical protein PVAND_013922 [Polypedilum vanderplanki]|uniref:Uncharacterized protein n=1 Tax=Polypedilum vanderplanki TaxID=319348 RepID=A0A9J6CS38_POLVA|nr:hypothetical protein PVAND_013922 [Polypedilum vanderplanki]
MKLILSLLVAIFTVVVIGELVDDDYGDLTTPTTILTYSTNDNKPNDSINETASNDTFVNEQLDGLNGLRFTKIGDMQLVIEQREITFNVNFTDLRNLMGLVFEEIKKTKTYLEAEKNAGNIKTDQTEYINELGEIEKYVKSKEGELNDLSFDFNGQETSTKNKRLKRDAETNINYNFNEVYKTQNQTVERLNLMRELYLKSKDLLSNITLEVTKQTVLNSLRTKVNRIIDIMEAIHSVQTRNRLSKAIVSLKEFQDSLKKINDTLRSDLALPYDRSSKYFYNLEVSHRFENDIFKLTIVVPIVQKVKRELFLIEEFPTFYNSTLQLTNVKWKYIAMSEYYNNSMTFKDLSLCTAPIESVYLCETQSPLINYNNSNDCATNSKRDGKIDIEKCEMSTFKVNHLLLIKLADGHFFYYTPNNETMNVSCNKKEDEILLSANTTGLLKLNKGCIATNDRYTLIGKTKYKEVSKFFTVNIGYDVDKLLRELANKTSPLFNQFYVDSLNVLREMSKPMKPLEMPEKPKMIIMQGSGTVATIFGSIFLVIFVLSLLTIYIKNKRGKKNKSKSKSPESP